MAGMLAQVMTAVQSMAQTQQQATALMVNQLAASATAKASPKTLPDSQQGHKPAQSARANYSPWSRHERKPEAQSPSESRMQARLQTPIGGQATAQQNHQPLPPATVRSQPAMRSPDAIVRMGNPQAESETSQMESRSRRIVEHENRHAAILRDAPDNTADAKPQFVHKQGPDGRKYAVAGEVNTDLKPIPGNPHATEQKAESVYRSALGNADRSQSDYDAARQAMFVAQEARQAKMIQRNSAGKPAMASPLNNEPPKASAYSVKMGNPLAVVGALLARGAMAVGRGVVAGARVVRRGGARAFQYASQAPTSRIGRGVSNYMGVGTRAEMVARSFQRLESSSDRLNSNFASMSERLRNFAPVLSVQMAQNNVNRMEQDLRIGQRLGPGLAEFEKQRGRIAIAAGNTQANFAEIMLPLATLATKTLATIAETGAVLSGGVASLVKMIGAFVDMSGRFLADLPLVRDILQILDKIYQWIKQWMPKQEEAKGVGNFNDFFRMEIPGPNAVPDIQGPRFNMPLPQFNPQPFVGGN